MGPWHNHTAWAPYEVSYLVHPSVNVTRPRGADQRRTTLVLAGIQLCIPKGSKTSGPIFSAHSAAVLRDLRDLRFDLPFQNQIQYPADCQAYLAKK